MPNADSTLAVARNQILAKQAEAEGITVSDDEIGSYAEQILGTSDIASLAQQYGLTEDQTKEVVRESAAMYKLKEKVCSTQAGTIPDAPTAPAEGAEDTATSDYGAYIVNLIGDEWDATNNTWARTDGPYYEAGLPIPPRTPRRRSPMPSPISSMLPTPRRRAASGLPT